MQVMAKDVSSRISPRGSVETKEIAALEVLYSPKNSPNMVGSGKGIFNFSYAAI